MAIPDPDYQLWALIHQVDRAIYKARDKEVRNLGISPMQAGIMFILSTSEKPVPINEIASWLFRELHTVSELITRMEKQGLVKRVRSRGKKTALGVVLSEKGEAIYRKQSRRRKVIRNIMSVLTDEEKDTIRNCMAKLRACAFDQLIERPEIQFP